MGLPGLRLLGERQQPSAGVRHLSGQKSILKSKKSQRNEPISRFRGRKVRLALWLVTQDEWLGLSTSTLPQAFM